MSAYGVGLASLRSMKTGKTLDLLPWLIKLMLYFIPFLRLQTDFSLPPMVATLVIIPDCTTTPTSEPWAGSIVVQVRPGVFYT